MRRHLTTTEKGEKAELELLNIFQNEGFITIKVPLSGRSQPMPDILVARRGILYGFEVKMSSKPKKKFMERDYDNLIEWLISLKREGIPVRGYLAVKIQKQWLFEEIDWDRREVLFPSETNISLEDMIKFLKDRRHYQKKMDCSIRLMGLKEDVYEILSLVQDVLKEKGYGLYIREYVMYKDKHERKEIDTSKTRVYIRVKGNKNSNN